MDRTNSCSGAIDAGNCEAKVEARRNSDGFCLAARVAGMAGGFDEIEQQFMLGEECKEQAFAVAGWRLGEDAFRAGQQIWRDGEGSG